MTQAGPVLVAVVGLWIAYLVPHRVRHRQQLLESRSEDRFSVDLRVLRVAGADAAGAPEVRVLPAPPARALLHPARRGGGALMDRPQAWRDRVEADAPRRSAAEHAQRAAHLARRAAAARRRAALTAALLVATVIAWPVVATTGAGVLVGLVPTAGLVGVLLLGRRAVVSAARADARWAAGAGTRPSAGRPHGSSTVGRAVHPSDSTTQVMARVPRAATGAGPAARGAGVPVARGAGVPVAHGGGVPVARGSHAASAGAPALPAAPVMVATELAAADPAGATGGWSPVPVPPPAYTMKAPAPRREPVPLVLPDPRVDAASSAGDAAARTAEEGAESRTSPAGAERTTPPPRGGATSPSLDLDEILARRRASGQ